MPEYNPAILSDSFNKFFTKIAQKIKSKIVPTNKNYTDYLTNPPDQNMIKTLSVGKSLGSNRLPIKL